MTLNIHNWTKLQEYFPNTNVDKEELKEVLLKNFLSYKKNIKSANSLSEIDTINIIFISSREIKRLNREFRKKDSVTDVLSFTIEQDPLIGEIYICPEYISQKYPFEEVLRDILHGFLHLLGYEHVGHFSEALESKEEMFVKQENILQNVLDEINNRVR
ncbi:MAG TPA: rRNA maturation RNase YbeY [Candidatus Dojkabacteria bacterium]|nr:rRNA maturation RNase YbeY [Candidatus Dojkabacteria bacterium]